MPSSLVQRIRIPCQRLFGRFRQPLRAVLSGYGDRGKPDRTRRNRDLGLYPAGAAFFRTTWGCVVTRLAIAIVISICSLLASVSVRAQSDQGAPQDASPSRQLTIAPREALEAVACEGGTVTGGKCTCPAEFRF